MIEMRRQRGLGLRAGRLYRTNRSVCRNFRAFRGVRLPQAKNRLQVVGMFFVAPPQQFAIIAGSTRDFVARRRIRRMRETARAADQGRLRCPFTEPSTVFYLGRKQKREQFECTMP